MILLSEILHQPICGLKISCMSGGTGCQPSVLNMFPDISFHAQRSGAVRMFFSFSSRMIGTCQVGEMIKQLDAAKMIFLHVILNMGQHPKNLSSVFEGRVTDSLGEY